MAPRVAARRERDNDFSAVGKIGRRTGITLQPRPLDENGIEEISGIFSSPRKPSPLRNSFYARGVEAEQGTPDISVEMVSTDSTGLTPTHVISTWKSLRGPSIPPPRSASPKKSGISGSARRSIGVDLFASAKDSAQYDPEDQENSATFSTSGTTQTAVQMLSQSPEKSPLRGITRATGAGINTSARDASAAGESPSGTLIPRAPVTVSINRDSPNEGDANYMLQSDNRGIIPEQDDGYQLPSIEDEQHNFNAGHTPEQTYDDEEADQTFEPQSDIPADEQGPAKANSRRKRKSDIMNRELSNGLPSSPAAKKARKIAKEENQGAKVQLASSATGVGTSSQTLKSKQTKAHARPTAKAAPSATQFSAQQEAELEQIVERVKARPGLAKSLYVLRRETPEDDGAKHTRSGRVSVRPLAYWRNERCVYGGSPLGSSLQDGARFPLNSIKEIIRTDEVETGVNRTKPKRNGKSKNKNKARSTSAADSESDENEAYEDPDAEPWESAVGIFRGNISVWDGQQQAPLEDEQEEIEMAYAPASIQTREVPGSSFQYAKLLSTRFFGSGIVDLPPGGLKRPKNSRKMHMSFFVAKGRVTVQMGPLGGEESRFSVGKGGFWQVPRGNQYSIENELEKPARIFFSQGCEVAAELE